MNRYEIKYTLNDMPEGYIGLTTKWAKDQKEALKYILKKAPSKNGLCTFKKGSIGRIISVQEKNER
tara:strand:- start:237 stop:434 length:198 start_codon:yes stop_codon:yes gene_type:complete